MSYEIALKNQCLGELECRGKYILHNFWAITFFQTIFNGYLKKGWSITSYSRTKIISKKSKSNAIDLISCFFYLILVTVCIDGHVIVLWIIKQTVSTISITHCKQKITEYFAFLFDHTTSVLIQMKNPHLSMTGVFESTHSIWINHLRGGIFKQRITN